MKCGAIFLMEISNTLSYIMGNRFIYVGLPILLKNSLIVKTSNVCKFN